ncbi:MAG TPA: EpsI family protein [Spirochaetota bacterium]|mgnify:CR=1 FL=1|nr:EpsI family protein [Spirochaetota bacterium]HPR49824.1 EpsI family protein [Spirochaetota bacterium]
MNIFKRVNAAYIKIALFTLFIIIFFSQGFSILYNRWFWAGSYYTHGPLVVLAFIWLLLRRFNDFRPSLRGPQKKSIGIIIIIFSLAMYLFGLWKNIPSFATWGMYVFVIGNSVLFFSVNFVMKNIGIYIYLLLAIPVPEVIINQVTFELNLFASYTSEILLSIIYPSTFRDGNILQVNGHNISITYECSGLSNLLSMFSIVWLMALLQPKKFISIIDYFISVPAAIISNILRIIIIAILIVNGYEQFALYDWHAEIGIIVFICIVVLIVFFNELPVKKTWSDFKNIPARLLSYFNKNNKIINTYIVSMILLCLIGFFIQDDNNYRYSNDTTLLKNKIPASAGRWQSQDMILGEDYFNLLGTDDLLMRAYQEKGKMIENDTVYLYIIRSKDSVSAFHRPELCLRGEGYELLTHDEIDLPINKKLIPVHRMLFVDRSKGLLVYYWYYLNGENIRDTIKYKLLFLFNRNKGSSGNFIRISKPVNLNNITLDEQTMKRFTSEVIPDVLEYL